MLYGIGVTAPGDVLKRAVASLPDCFSQELSNCIDHDNVEGLPAAQCKAITDAFAGDAATNSGINDAVNSLPICKGMPLAPFVGGAFALGVLVTVMFVRR
jgi:hypothetical protein